VFPFLLDTDLLGAQIVIPTSTVFTLVAMAASGLLFILLQPDKSKRGSLLVFAAAVAAGTLVGARLLQFVLELMIFPGRIALTVFAESGSTVIGGLLGGGLTALIYKRAHRGGYITRRTFDAAVVAFAFGDALLRIGCFFGGCCFGTVCAPSPLALSYPPDWIMYRFYHLAIPAGPRLPFPFIAAAALAAIGLVLLVVYRREKVEGLTASLFFMLYGIYRFAIEFIRDEPLRLFIGPLSFAQWFALACLLVGIVLLVYTRFKKTPVAPAAGPPA
jgi:phosphatidylglycerol:prolipoprotein diacylglycerol transferase